MLPYRKLLWLVNWTKLCNLVLGLTVLPYRKLLWLVNWTKRDRNGKGLERQHQRSDSPSNRCYNNIIYNPSLLHLLRMLILSYITEFHASSVLERSDIQPPILIIPNAHEQAQEYA